MDTNPDSVCEEDSLPSEVSDPVNIQTNSSVPNFEHKK
jgi:hypothetical protein